jgi:sulfur carrier protein
MNVEVVLNGERQAVPAGLSIRDLLRHLAIPDDRVAVERNRAIVPRQDWDRVPVEAGDELEIVHFVGGG